MGEPRKQRPLLSMGLGLNSGLYNWAQTYMPTKERYIHQKKTSTARIEREGAK